MSLAEHRLMKGTDAAFKQALGISTTQLGALFILESKDATSSELSEGLGVNASAITTLIDRMEKAGLVHRKPSSDDGRVVHLVATAQGLAKAAAARPILARLNSKLTRDFSEREIATVSRFLGSILERF
jgi:DNA-binding MarR family transcriptional regulator